MNTIDWIFLTELLVISGFWILLCAWNSHFKNEKELRNSAHNIILRKYQEKTAAGPGL